MTAIFSGQPLLKSEGLVAEIAVILTTLVVVFLYLNSLSGIFIFDDYANLKQLSLVDSFESGWRYVFGGASGPTGRPVSLLSFAVQAGAWPARPDIFIASNIAIHALNILLVYCLFTKLLKLFGFERNQTVCAAGVAIIWALLANHVSSVSYVVQRMTLLSATFGLSSLIMFLKLCAEIDSGRLGKIRQIAYLIISFLFFALSVLSKENTLTLAFVFVAIGVMVSVHVLKNRLVYIVIAAHSVLSIYIAYYLLSRINSGFFESTVIRSFSVFERLVTECKIFTDYLSKFLFPRPFTKGLFHDDMTAVSGTADVALYATLGGVLFILNLWFIYRVIWKKCILSFCLMFFFICHLLESSTITLELYYEHRNYLPFVGLAGFVAILFIGAMNRAPRFARYSIAAIALSWLLWQAWALSERTRFWGDPFRSSYYWAEINPQSVRAQQHAALVFSRVGKYDLAIKYLNRAYNVDHSPYTLLTALQLSCANNYEVVGVTFPLDDVKDAAFANDAVHVLFDIVAKKDYLHCEAMGSDNIIETLRFTVSNDNFNVGGQRAAFKLMLGIAYLHVADIENALRVFDNMYSDGIRENLLKVQVIHLKLNGFCEEAKKIHMRGPSIPSESVSVNGFLNNFSEGNDVRSEIKCEPN